MIRRLYFPIVTLFWVAMNLLLWRSEMSARSTGGSPVPVDLVWEKILTAPDDSSLVIHYQGRKLGHCRWAANIVEDRAADPAAEETEIEGRVRRTLGYTLDFEGNLVLEETPQRLRFAWHAGFGPRRTWRDMSLRLTLRPHTWEVRAEADKELVTFRQEESDRRWERQFTFEDLARPERVLAAFGLPFDLSWMSGLATGLGGIAPRRLALGLQWEARTDWFTLAQSRLRAYRLEARLLDKYRAVVIVSRVGEILRVELPNDLVLVNEAVALHP